MNNWSGNFQYFFNCAVVYCSCIVFAFGLRRQKFQDDLTVMKWKVTFSDIVLVHTVASRSLASADKVNCFFFCNRTFS